MRILLLGVVAFILCSASVAHAQWDNTLSYEPANSASLKVVGTEGLRIDIDVDGVSKTDNVPAIFNLDNLNAFVNLTATASDGQTWTKKIEVKEYQQTILKLTYKAAAAAAPATAGRKYIGTVANETSACAAADQANVSFDFMKDGNKAYTFTVSFGDAKKTVEVEAGSYEVRIFLHQSGDEWTFKQTVPFVVDKDGWEYYWGCR